MKNLSSAQRIAGLLLCTGLLALPIVSQSAPLSTVESLCQRLSDRVKGLSEDRCLTSNLAISGASTVQKQPILIRYYQPTSKSSTARRILLIGGIHGDEISSVGISFEWMARLSVEKFQPFQWLVVPVVNPDGVLNQPSTRMNANKVDLNRNFPTPNWDVLANQYWVGKTKRDPRRFPGPSAGSEPETQWLMEQIRVFQPDAIVSIHAPYGVLDFDGPRTPPRKLGFLNLNELGTYPGSLGNYAGVQMGIPVITIELPDGELTPTPEQSARLWRDLLTWLERNIPKGEPPTFQRLESKPWTPPISGAKG